MVGLAIARELAQKGYRNLTILEKESTIVKHQYIHLKVNNFLIKCMKVKNLNYDTSEKLFIRY